MDNRIEWQIECDNTICNYNNVILSSPTGSGKTDRYERWAFSKAERPIFITSPIKALSNQKFRQLLSKGYKVGLVTGDVSYFSDDNCDIICCTQEIYNNEYKDIPNSTLVIDEFSYIFKEPERARSYMESLCYTSAKNIIICSATFQNPSKIKEYIEHVTNREFYLYENNNRLTSLEYKGKINSSKIINSFVVSYSQKRCKMIARKLYESRVNKYRNYNLGNIENISKKNRKVINEFVCKYKIDNKELVTFAELGIVYYFGALLPKEKLFIEELFENKIVDTVVGTDALALGVNFPIQNVVFTELSKVINREEIIIDKNLFEQLSGRAGRKGYYDNGYVYYCDDFKYLLDYNVDMKKIYTNLVNTNHNDFNITLAPNIKDILMCKASVYDELNFIGLYSTESFDKELEKTKLLETLDYIRNFDMAMFYMGKVFTGFKLEPGYESSLDNFTESKKKKWDTNYKYALELKDYFDVHIGDVYLRDYSVEENCTMFAEVLSGTDIDRIINKYCKDFYKLLLFRKFIIGLPEKFLGDYSVEYIDRIIELKDHTVLHPNIVNNVIEVKKQEKSTIKNIKVEPITKKFFNKIEYNGRKYILLSVGNGRNLVSDMVMKNLMYKDSNELFTNIGFEPRVNVEKLLEQIDENTIDKQYQEDVKRLKLGLKKGRK